MFKPKECFKIVRTNLEILLYDNPTLSMLI